MTSAVDTCHLLIAKVEKFCDLKWRYFRPQTERQLLNDLVNHYQIVTLAVNAGRFSHDPDINELCEELTRIRTLLEGLGELPYS